MLSRMNFWQSDKVFALPALLGLYIERQLKEIDNLIRPPTMSIVRRE